jgi:AraC-like DNA-binding protein
MKYTEIIPGERLRPYVKCYFAFESETEMEIEDTVFPSGHMEFIFNLGTGIWKSAVNNIFHKTPPVELWGQLTQPLAIQAQGKNQMLGIRFHTHAPGYFLKEEISEFNNQIADLRDLLGASVKLLHEQLLNIPPLNKKIELIENFLIGRMALTEKKSTKIALVSHIMREMKQKSFAEKVETVASRYDISPRYLQNLFLQSSGVTPKLFGKINRFQHSLSLINQKNNSLTNIAYESGYFDQSHFIREFKSFTGVTPSTYSPESYPISFAFANG